MFVHLHVHSEYSLLESSIKIKDLVSAASNLRMKAVALTDKYVMSGAVEFYKEAKAMNLKPVIGCEICLARSGRLSHLTLLVKDQAGYENLCEIVGMSYLRLINTRKTADKAQVEVPDFISSPDLPIVEMPELRNNSKGLICLSGCSKGELPYLLKNGRAREAEDFALELSELFEKDFYIEIQRYGLTSSNNYKNLASENLVNFAQRNGTAVAATNNVHYLGRQDFEIYRSMAKLKMMGTKNDPTSAILENSEHHFKSECEMSRMFRDIPEAITNTQKIADKCSFEFSLDKINIPHYMPENGESQEKYLSRLCRRGLKFRYGESPSRQVLDRLAMELEVIANTGYTGYFLIVADIARFACENKIPICGKGSAAGSLVSYILRISNVEPIGNKLYFERFLNKERKEPPDIDIDISSKDRGKVAQYLMSKYGKTNISRVCSFSTTKPRASIREAGRILSIGKEEVDFIIKAVPNYNRFFSQEDMRAGAESSSLIDASNTQYKKIVSLSRDIGGYVRHVSMHPSAFIVSNEDLLRKIPLTISETGEIMSQYDMNSIEDLGILKIDLINSLSLSLIAETADILKNKRNISLNLSDTDYSDSNVYKLMQSGQTLGVFQLESFGIRTLSRKVKPSSLNDITLLISLYRPGPQQSGMVTNFIERKFGREKTTFLHRDLEPILGDTYGVILYQEQAMQAAIKIAGYSFSEADNLRKAMTRLSKEEMRAHEERFINGALSKGYDPGTAGEIFNLISKFASYGFVKAHAAAYAELSYKTCYLKAYFPAEFFSIILTNNSGYWGKMQYIEEARRLGIRLELPDINKSGFGFFVEDDGKSIRTSLLSVRSLGYAGAVSIINEREKGGKFRDFFDFYLRISKNCRLVKTAVENLIKVGAFDFTGLARKQLLLIFYYLKSLKKPDLCYSNSITGYEEQGNYYLDNFINRPATNLGRDINLLERVCAGSQLAAEHLQDFSPREKLEIEEDVLGFYISSNPLECLKKELEISGITRSKFFYRQGLSFQKDVAAAGIIISKRIEKTKGGSKMLFCTMEDEDGMYEAVFFPDSYIKNAQTVMNNSFIIIRGRLHSKDNNVSLIARDAISIKLLKNSHKQLLQSSIKTSFI
ncbi:MAG: DNA polymerase III subunit alpha [Actinobacteria bacterium]|nr:DNA polymerase III subunit alpha [Actinomycetota bacterium]